MAGRRIAALAHSEFRVSVTVLTLSLTVPADVDSLLKEVQEVQEVQEVRPGSRKSSTEEVFSLGSPGSPGSPGSQIMKLINQITVCRNYSDY